MMGQRCRVVAEVCEYTAIFSRSVMSRLAFRAIPPGAASKSIETWEQPGEPFAKSAAAVMIRISGPRRWCSRAERVGLRLRTAASAMGIRQSSFLVSAEKNSHLLGVFVELSRGVPMRRLNNLDWRAQTAALLLFRRREFHRTRSRRTAAFMDSPRI